MTVPVPRIGLMPNWGLSARKSRIRISHRTEEARRSRRWTIYRHAPNCASSLVLHAIYAEIKSQLPHEITKNKKGLRPELGAWKRLTFVVNNTGSSQL